MEDLKNKIGVIVARLQVHDLHEGHKHIINYVTNIHKKTIIFLGVPKFVGRKSNPLDYDTRKKMLQAEYPNVVVAPLPDKYDNPRWVQELDKRIREIYLHGDVILYGSRDSFLNVYKEGNGLFNTSEVEQLGTFTGTNIRNIISEDVKNSSDFRAGVIYNAYNSFPRVIPTIDIIPLNSNGDILLAKKYEESGYRLIGGFALPTDDDFVKGAKRIFKKETGGNCEADNFSFVTTKKIDDWRFKSEDDKIITTLFEANILWGNITPSDDISELRYFSLLELSKSINMVVKEHQELIQYYLNTKTK